MSSAHTDCPTCTQAARHGSRDARQVPGTAWRWALIGLFGAPMRLHRYRNLHTAVLEDAIQAYDCCTPCEQDS